MGMISKLDLKVGERQAFGASFAKRKSSHAAAVLLMEGELKLPPHPIWSSGSLQDWSADPFKDRNWRFQRHTLRWTMPLIHAALDGDSNAQDLWLEIITSWTRSNSIERPSTKETWTDMAVGMRSIVLSIGARLVREGDSSWFIDLLELHRDWLVDPKNLGRGNHALHQHQGLLVVGSTLRDRSAKELAIGRMAEQFRVSFDDDGANDEGSTGYHQLNIIWWKLAWDRAQREGFIIPEEVDRILANASKVLAHMTTPSGKLFQIGDGALTKVEQGLGDYSDAIATQGAVGSFPDENYLLLDRGYGFSRDSWSSEATALVFRHGVREMSGHPHEDRGAVLLSTNGINWLVDSGFSSYQTGDPVVAYLRSQRAHNTSVLVNQAIDQDQTVDISRYEITEEYRDFVLEDNRYESADFTRRIMHFLEPDIVIISDKARRNDGKEVTIEQRWHLQQNVRAKMLNRGYELKYDGKSATLYWLDNSSEIRQHAAVEGDNQGWLYPKWKTAVASNVITATAKRIEPSSVVLFGRNTPYELGIVGAYVTSSGVIDLTVSRGLNVWHIVISDTIEIRKKKSQTYGT